MSEAFVDVTYRGLEVGRRLKLTQVGPSTAYLEHGTPMPVGAQVELAAEDGVTIAAVVLRVHEQVAGAEQVPGMRLRAAALEGAAAGWWRSRVSCADPVIPEEQAMPTPRTVPVAVVAAAPGVKTASPEARTMMMAAVEPPPDVEAATEPPQPQPQSMEMDADEPPDEEEAPKTIMMAAVEPPPDDEEPAAAGGNGHPSRTMIMTAVEIKEALGDAAEPERNDEGGNGNGNGGPAADDSNARGKRRRRRRR